VLKVIVKLNLVRGVHRDERCRADTKLVKVWTAGFGSRYRFASGRSNILLLEFARIYMKIYAIE
jgi:hypothetical protein